MTGAAPPDGGPIFIGGEGRSGTTLLAMMLDSHPELAIGPELHFRGPVNLGPYVLDCIARREAAASIEGWMRLKDESELYNGVHFVNRCHRFGVDHSALRSLIEQVRADLGGDDLETFEARCRLVDAIGSMVCRETGARRWGIKIMRDLRIADQYARAWPGAQFVHLVRDGRDVAASQLRDHATWGYDDIDQAAERWVDLIRRARQAGATLPVHEVRYEDIVIDPEPHLRSLLAALGVSWSDSVLRHEQADHALFRHPYDHPSLQAVRRPVTAEAVGRYARDLAAGDIARFESVASETLRSLNYECHA
jgi:hypothetical protein